jgi:hypothetical protein
MSGTGSKFFSVKELGGRTYIRTALTIGAAAAKAAGVKFSLVGSVVDCPTLADLSNLYTYFEAGNNDQAFTSTSTRFRDLGSRAYFKVKGFVVQTWALVTVVEGKLTEGAGNPSIWLPVYCSFDATLDGVFDAPHVISLNL